MPVLVGLFASYRDAEEALGALEALGLDPGNGHLYQGSRHGSPLAWSSEMLDETFRAEERAEYAAHGEYLSVCGASNRFGAGPGYPQPTGTVVLANADVSMRTLLIVDLGDLRPAAGTAVLYDYGAVAVKDASGHWRFSPYRNVCRSEE